MDSQCDPQQGQGHFLFTTVSRPALRPTQLPIKWELGVSSLRVKSLGCKADHLCLVKVKVKVKLKLSLCLTKHHTMKAYWGSGGIAPCIL